MTQPDIDQETVDAEVMNQEYEAQRAKKTEALARRVEQREKELADVQIARRNADENKLSQPVIGALAMAERIAETKYWLARVAQAGHDHDHALGRGTDEDIERESEREGVAHSNFLTWNGSIRDPEHLAEAVREAETNEEQWLSDRIDWFADMLGDMKTDAEREAKYATEAARILGIYL